MIPALMSIFLLAAGASTGIAHHAKEAVVPLHNGENQIDLLGNGTKAIAVVGWRDNFNAHGFWVVGFYIIGADPNDASEWEIVPFFHGPHDPPDGTDVYRTQSGADCTLADLRIVRRTGSAAEVIKGSRPIGESFANPAIVRFDYYRLTRNADGIFGWPRFYFAHLKTVRTARAYCDVNEAFDKELGLGHVGVASP